MQKYQGKATKEICSLKSKASETKMQTLTEADR